MEDTCKVYDIGNLEQLLIISKPQSAGHARQGHGMDSGLWGS